MKQVQQQRTSPPVEYWIILGIALRASGLFYHILFIIGLYFLFKHLQPLGGFAILTVTSIFVGMAVSQIYSLLVFHPELYSSHRILEPVIVAFAAVALLFTQKRGWAWALIIYSALGGILFFIGAVYHFPKATNPRSLFLEAILCFIELWLLSSWIRIKPYVATLNDIKPKDIDVPSRLTPIKPVLSTDKINSGRKRFSFPFNDQPTRPSGLISIYSLDDGTSG